MGTFSARVWKMNTSLLLTVQESNPKATGCKGSWEMRVPVDQLISHTPKITCGACSLIKKERRARRDDSVGLYMTCVWMRRGLHVCNPVLWWGGDRKDRPPLGLAGCQGSVRNCVSREQGKE